MVAGRKKLVIPNAARMQLSLRDEEKVAIEMAAAQYSMSISQFMVWHILYPERLGLQIKEVSK